MVKQQVLAALDAARGRYISGQELAAQLGVSRTAVWKAVAALRSDGIPIEAVTNRGYALAADADVLNAAAVAALEPGQVSDVIETDNALYVAVGRELNRSAVVNALFETRIKDAVANAQVDYNTRLYNKLNVGDFYTKLQEARAALS